MVIRRLSDGVITRTLRDSNAIEAMAISPDGRLLLTASTNLKFWRISDGSLWAVYDQETEGVGPVAISADGRYFAYGRADGVVVLARMPLLINSVSQTPSQTILQWQGGSGLYQVQQRTNLTTSAWQNVGQPTTGTSATNSIQGGNIFYRVQSLPNP